MNYYRLAFKKYATFTGRATRAEYWYFQLVNALIVLVLSILDQSSGSAVSSTVLVVYWLAALLPNLGVTFRRLHDTGRSGWWIFIHCIPLVGALIMLYFLVQDSYPSDNQYGQNPKYNL